MIHINVWIALTQQAKNTLRPLLNDETYNGQHLTAVKIIRRCEDYATVERMFKTPTIQGKVRYLYSLTFNDIGGQAAQKLQAALDHLAAEYANQFDVVGAWLWDGRQVGTQWMDPEDHSQGTTGTPLYPLHPKLLDFMPDVWDGVAYDPETESPNYVLATALTDVNLIQGQANRQFS